MSLWKDVMNSSEDKVRHTIDEITTELQYYFHAVLQFYRWQRSTRKQVCCELAQSGLLRLQLAKKELDLRKRLMLIRYTVLYQQLEINYSSRLFEKFIYMWMFKRSQRKQRKK
jgi:hypothetical protein